MEVDWAAAAAWANRPSTFGSLRPVLTHFVGMEFVPPTIDASWPALRARWCRLPRHGNLLNAIDAAEPGVLLRYAALNWWKPVHPLDGPEATKIAAAFGAQLADVFEMILQNVRGADLGLFLQPFACIDLDDELRVGFDCGAGMRPPEMKLDERAFIFVIGRLWMSMLDHVPTDGIGKIMRQCVDINRRARLGSFEKLRYACFDFSAPRGLRSEERLAAWYLLEEGIGWRACGERANAHRCFEMARHSGHYRTIAMWGSSVTRRRPITPWEPTPVEPPAPPPPPPPMTPARALYVGGRELLLKRKLEEAHASFTSAIALDPMMLEAQLLRREVERMLARLRSTTGIAVAPSIDVPESLRDVREIVMLGRIRDAIAALSTEKFSTNVDAPLFRARLLAMDQQYERAAEVFAAIVDGPHRDEARLGLARVMIDREQFDEALALLDEILVTRPRDLGALEARARCLELLGRASDASEAMRAFVAAVELASDARLSRVP